MTDRLPADIALEQHALGRMERDPAGHGFVDDGILDEGTGRHLAGHVEMDGVVAELAALAHILELDALDLDLLEALAENHMGAEIVAEVRLLLDDDGGRSPPISTADSPRNNSARPANERSRADPSQPTPTRQLPLLRRV